MNIVFFEDQHVERLYPITLTRPAYAVTCGAWSLLDFVRSISEISHGSEATICGQVREMLAEFQHDYSVGTELYPARKTLWINSRLVPTENLRAQLQNILQSNGSLKAVAHDEVAFALTPSGLTWDGKSALNCEETIDVDAPLLTHPHDVIFQHANQMGSQVERIASNGNYREYQEGVFVRGTPQIHESVVFDSRSGKILIEDDVTIDPFAVVKGPVRIGQRSYVAPHSHLKGPVTIGEHCKVGGEISKTTVESYSNKVHHGYLGSSYLGSWVNLGAGTSNSNLKNTYGSVRVDYETERVDTGMQFLGCVIGDYSKTAINTSIYTGKIIGVCSNVYGAVTTNVPSFSNYARSFGEVTEQPADVMEVTQARVFARRGIEQLPRHRQLLRDLYQIESPKRELANQPPSL